MKAYKFDVIIIGAGPAGAAAAGVLAGSGVSVAMLEAGVYAGAENWSGCVYFAECLAEKDCFGPEAVLNAPFERRVVRRGTLLHNGLDVVGVDYTDPSTFADCYTVIRPIYDPYFAHLAREKGAVILTNTAVTFLIRKNGAVIGVDTSRGQIYADVVFIAEGDASHLVRAEGLERSASPHFMQGVKAVLSLPSQDIEQRFGLKSGEGSAHELLIRNAAIAGKTARLNMAGFLYTNRDSLSLGYVLPLDNLRDHYRGGHDLLFEWLKGIPYIAELTAGASLSAYGAKIIRSGGWIERPTLVEDGLAVGGAAAGLGVDMPFPNFTGPAAATGLLFGRAVKTLLKEGRGFGAKELKDAYIEPLQGSVYGRNARYLSSWPGYFGRSRVLFTRTADLVCGSARFFSSDGIMSMARFFRSHLTLGALKEFISDGLQAITALRLWKPIVGTLFHPATIAKWFANLAGRQQGKGRMRLIIRIGGQDVPVGAFARPIRSFVERLLSGIEQAIGAVYANDRTPVEGKLSYAARAVIRSIRATDLVAIPAFGIFMSVAAVWSAVWDAVRFYILRVGVDEFLNEPVMKYNEALKKARAVDSVKPVVSLDAKLATNSYKVDAAAHIRTVWPVQIERHQDMSRAGLWWVCPARVYVYDAPLIGRGKATVNFESCIKCESCWRAEPDRVLWSRHTNHRLIYRPESSAMGLLVNALKSGSANPPARPPEISEVLAWGDGQETQEIIRRVVSAASAFRDAVVSLPRSADRARLQWPGTIAQRLVMRLKELEAALSARGMCNEAEDLGREREALAVRINEGRLFHALYVCLGLERRLSGEIEIMRHPRHEANGLAGDDVSSVFPDRFVKSWEESAMPAEWAKRLRSFLSKRRNEGRGLIRALSSVSPALGLIALHHLDAHRILSTFTGAHDLGACSVKADVLEIREPAGLRIKGKAFFVPLAAAKTLLIGSSTKSYILPLDAEGLNIISTPSIGFRAAGLSEIYFDSIVPPDSVISGLEGPAHDCISYLAVALGAGDYLLRRVKEHAIGRVQFPGQMLDTEGRDGIAKLGAVKAMIARIESWRLLLEALYEQYKDMPAAACRDYGLLCAAVAAKAFGPEQGSMGWDAGQVFGGFAYSEDDLLSRFYRDSSLFRFLPHGLNAARDLHTVIGKTDLDAFLAPDLGDLDAVSEPPLQNLAERWKGIKQMVSALSPECDPHLTGEAEAVLLGIKRLILGIEAKIESGLACESESSCIETLLNMAEEAVSKAEISAGWGRVSSAAVFPVAPSLPRLDIGIDYDAFCKRPGRPHVSGSFLISVFDRSPRFLPEMQLHDKALRRRWEELADWFRENCSERTWDNLCFERYVEQLHNLPDEIISAVKRYKWLATYIPEAEGGLGWTKAEYYILNSAAGSFGDAGICLLIMASTSIGTTPILLGLEDELPRVRDELNPLIEDSMQLGEIANKLRRLTKALDSPNPTWIRKEYEAVMRMVDERIRRTRVVKYLAANFLKAFYGAGIAGRRGDFAEFAAGLRRADELFKNLMPDISFAIRELPRRERCHKYFLRTLGHGGVSAFALTEPTAGSDSGGVKTSARLRKGYLRPMPDGRYYFLLDEEDNCSIRYMIDADRIVFTTEGMAYLTPDDTPAIIKYDRYSYSTDTGVRYFTYKGKEYEFHDIGQVRTTIEGPVYEYYVLSGAKMWITNGSIATQFCLYAQTEEGVTGFLVDRHAEGLKIGADEKKMGQRGSPTNEIAIDNVRVPREAVIGYEGHGQVNALETLNVGRCGLAVVSGALMRKLLAEARRNIPESVERDRLLGEAAAVLFGSESLAYYLIGLFDRPHESVRMESAIAKYACSEDIHEVISLLERAYGPSGQTEKFLLEKARRDSRILAVYEGTNEVQRFLILKDLVALADKWPELPKVLSERPDDSRAVTLSTWKNRLRHHVKEAAARFGDAAWADAMLQPAMFPLADMAGEILRLECTYYRMEWLEERRQALDTVHLAGIGYASAMLNAAARAAERALARLFMLDAIYLRSWNRVKENLGTPEVIAADAALGRDGQRQVQPPVPQFAHATRLRILSILRAAPEISPLPRLADGKVEELVWSPDPLDLCALRLAAGLKASTRGDIRIESLMICSRFNEAPLRFEAGIADAIYRIDPEVEDSEITSVIERLESLGMFDLIILGSHDLEGNPGLGPFIAGRLGREYRTLRQSDTSPDRLSDVPTPAVVCVAAEGRTEMAGINSAISSLFMPVQVLEVKQSAGRGRRYELPGAGAGHGEAITNIDAAAEYLKRYALASSRGRADLFHGPVTRGGITKAPAVFAILDPGRDKQNAAVLMACRRAAGIYRRKAAAVVPAPIDMRPAVLGLAQVCGMEEACCIDTDENMLSEKGKLEVIKFIMSRTEDCVIMAGTSWNSVLAYTAGASYSRGIGQYYGVVEIRENNGAEFGIPAFDNRLIQRRRHESGPAFITITEDAETVQPQQQAAFQAFEIEMPLEKGLLAPLPPAEEPTLSKAEVIIDLGYGIRGPSGLELAMELKKKLASMGLESMFGATRKVTQDLKLLPLEAQIGQTGVRVNPRLVIALGISGAPQHIDWIGTRAEIFCFNKDSDAPLMKLNQTRPAPRVHPIEGDLFVTVKKLIEKLK